MEHAGAHRPAAPARAAEASRAGRLARVEPWAHWILGAAFGALYFASFDARSDGVITGNDVVTYADAMVAGGEPLSSVANHLGYHWLSRAAYEALAWLPGSVPGTGLALRAQQLVAAAGGACLVAALARLCARAAGWRLALAFVACVGLCHGIWWSAAVGDSYVPAMGASAWLLCLALAPALGGAPPRPALLAALLAVAATIRQDALLIVPALAVLLPWRRLLFVLGAAGAATLCLYALGWLASGSPLSFAGWVIGIADAGDAPWAKGWTREGLAIARLQLAYVVQAADLFREGALEVSLAPLALAVALSWPWRRARAIAACAVHVAACLAFYTWWEAANVEYQIPGLLPLAALVAVLLREARARALALAQVAALAVTACALCYGAWGYAIGPRRGLGASENTRLALAAAGAQGRVFALDGWQALELTRELRFELDGPFTAVKTFDVDGAAAPGSVEAANELRMRLMHLSRNGRDAVVVGDLALPPAQVGPRRADPEVLARILDGIAHAPVLGPRGRVVAWRVEPDVR